MNKNSSIYLLISHKNKPKLTLSLLTICLCISYSRKGRASDTSLDNSGLKRLISDDPGFEDVNPNHNNTR